MRAQNRNRGRTKADWRPRVRRRLSKFAQAQPDRPAEPAGSRGAAALLARRVALDCDTHFQASHDAGAGPIDVIDLFSGCGGMSAGFAAVNAAVPAFGLRLAVDIDRVANETYARNLGKTALSEDVAALAGNPQRLLRLTRDARRGDDGPLVLIGCAPCQGFSSHRNSAGEDDPRNSLFVDFARAAAALEPDFVVAENVPELLTDRYWPIVEQARSILEARGYLVHLAVHNMAAFGVPQERFRALILAARAPFLAPTGFVAASRYRTVRDAISRLPGIRAGESDPDDAQHFTANHRESTLETIRQVPRDGGNRPPHAGPPSLRRIAQRQGKLAYEDVYGRLHWDRPAITVTAYARNPASGRFVHPEQDRGLSVREAALLQGFPDSYTFEGSFDDRFRQIGNAVPPPFAAAAAAHVLGELLSRPAGRSRWDPGITGPLASSFSRLIPSLKAAARAASNGDVASSDPRRPALRDTA